MLDEYIMANIDGARAKYDGLPIDANPFEKETVEYAEWISGWKKESTG